MKEYKVDTKDYPQWWDYVCSKRRLIWGNGGIQSGDKIIVTDGSEIYNFNVYGIDHCREEYSILSKIVVPNDFFKNHICYDVYAFFYGTSNIYEESIDINVVWPYNEDNKIRMSSIGKFSILTGINGVGKTIFLNQLMQSNCVVEDAKGWEVPIMVTPYSIDNLLDLKRKITLADYNNLYNLDECHQYDFQYKNSSYIDIDIFNKVNKEKRDYNIDTIPDACLDNNSSLIERKNHLNYFKKKYHLCDNIYYTELVNIAISLNKDIRQLTDKEIIDNSTIVYSLSDQTGLLRYLQNEINQYLGDLYSNDIWGRERKIKYSPIYLINKRLDVIDFPFYLRDIGNTTINELMFFKKEDAKEHIVGKCYVYGNCNFVKYNDLSTGQKMIFRLVVMSAKYHYSNTLVLDEPDAHLHPSLCEKMIDTLKTLSETGTRVIITSHNPVTIARGANSGAKLYVMECGDNDIRSIRETDVRKAVHSISDNLMEQINSDYFGFFATILNTSKNNIVFVEGSTDVIHLNKAIEMFKEQYPLLHKDFDFKAVGGSTELDLFYNFISSPLFKKYFSSSLKKKVVFLGDCDNAGKNFKNKKPLTKNGELYYTEDKGIAFFTIQPPQESGYLCTYCPVEFLYPFEQLSSFSYNGFGIIEKIAKVLSDEDIKRKEKTDPLKLQYNELKERKTSDARKLFDIYREEIEKDDSVNLIAYVVTSRYVDGTYNHFDVDGNKQDTIKDKFADYIQEFDDSKIFEGFKPTLDLLDIVAKQFTSEESSSDYNKE